MTRSEDNYSELVLFFSMCMGSGGRPLAISPVWQVLYPQRQSCQFPCDLFEQRVASEAPALGGNVSKMVWAFRTAPQSTRTLRGTGKTGQWDIRAGAMQRHLSAGSLEPHESQLLLCECVCGGWGWHISPNLSHLCLPEPPDLTLRKQRRELSGVLRV